MTPPKVRYPKIGEVWCWEAKSGGFIFAEIEKSPSYCVSLRWRGESNMDFKYFAYLHVNPVTKEFTPEYSSIDFSCWENHSRNGRLTYIGVL